MVQKMLVAVWIVFAAHAASAQGSYGYAAGCPQLSTLDMMRQRLEMLRSQREAGIYQLPTAEHQRRAMDSLYRWYWTELSQIERQRTAIEMACERAAQMRGDAITRVAPLPQAPQTPDSYPPYATQPAPNDPFAGGPGNGGQTPTWDDPFSGGAPGPRYPPSVVRTYPPYRDPRTGMVYPPVAPQRPRYPSPPRRQPGVERSW